MHIELLQALRAQTKGLRYTISDNAPSTRIELGAEPSLVVWSGASNQTIFKDPQTNYLFRAWHDTLHIRYNLDFTSKDETILADISRAIIGGTLGDIFHAEIYGQLKHLETFGVYPTNQAAFITNWLEHKHITKQY